MTDFRARNDTPDIEAFYEERDPTAGRELDVRIAIRIFGWIEHPFELNSEQRVVVPPDWTDFSARTWWGREIHRLVPCYSTSMQQAWLVVEKLSQELGFDIDVSSKQGWEYGCRIAPKGEFNTPRVVFEAAQTAPRAICRAALKVMGG